MKKIVSLFIIVTMLSCTKIEQNQSFRSYSGNAFGTSFTISYQDLKGRDFSKQIDSLIYEVNKSLSTYLVNSDISKINRGDTTIVVDAMFEEVFFKSNRIFKETEGYFDPTVGILVNAWGFGPGNELKKMNAFTIDSLMQYVGFDKVKLNNNRIEKEHPQIYFDFNAIAKGYGIDVIGRYLESMNCANYLVEIGGEIRVKGKNSENNFWKIGLEDPNTDGSRSINNIVELVNKSMATSGNYRKFKLDDKGHRYVHTINAKTGYAVASDLLSATVIANLDCADVDGYATAFMAMGLDRTKLFLKNHPELKVVLIFTNKEGEINTFNTVN